MPEKKVNLNFHLSMQYETDGKKQKAFETANLARQNFIDVKKYDGQVKKTLEALISRIQTR